ncbi:MAG: hypothetical protein QW818_02455 [Candidatus Aenigmatarchaeota archaeon]
MELEISIEQFFKMVVTKQAMSYAYYELDKNIVFVAKNQWFTFFAITSVDFENQEMIAELKSMAAWPERR